MKRIVAVLVALVMMLSLASCGNYEITIERNGDEKTQASDSVMENDEEIIEDENDYEEEMEEETEEEIVIDGVPSFTDDVKQNKKLIEAYLRTLMDFDDFDKEKEEDDLDEYGYYTMTYEKNGYADADVDLEITLNGNDISMPSDLDTLEEIGLEFAASVYNSDSEFGKNTFGDIKMKNSDGEQIKVTFLNNNDYDAALSDCIVSGFSFANINDAVDYSINGIGENSTLEDIISEFGTPYEISYRLFDDGNIKVFIYYANWTDGETWAEEKFNFQYDLCNEEMENVYYEIPNHRFK